MKPQHTPLPWAVVSESYNEKMTWLVLSKDTHVCTTHNEEDAAFIVRAVNAHEELLEALKRAEEWIRKHETNGTIPDNETYWALKQAIACAEGKE